MTRQEIMNEVKQTLGVVPEWMMSVPDHVLEHEWSILRDFQLGQTAIPNKYKELMGLCAAATLECPYCINFHTEAAKLWGASEEEIKEALLMAKLTSGWSTYISGAQYDLNKFKQETASIVKYVGGKMKGEAKAA